MGRPGSLRQQDPDKAWQDLSKAGELAPSSAAIQRLHSDGVIGGTQLIVGKMTAFAPKPLASAVPAPLGASMLARLGGLGYALSYRWKQDHVPEEMKHSD